MSKKLKIGGIILFVGFLNIFGTTAIEPQTGADNLGTEQVTWDNTLMLPALGGKANIGIAGAFSGFIGDNLVIAGGANFPDAPPWNGGHKTWWSILYYINTTQPDAKWTVLPEGLPYPLAYGNSIELASGILCIGGCDSARCYRDVFQIQMENGQIKIDTDWPALPVPLANATATLLNNKIYIAGGQEKMDEQEATGHFFVLDLANRRKGWKELPSWPGVSRGYAVSTAQNDGYDTCFYLFSGRNYKVDGYIKVLTDGYVYNPRLNTWKKLKQEFPVMAGTALASGTNHILLLGGVPELIPGSDKHPGFDNTVRLYHTITNSLTNIETAPFPIAVTTHIARKGTLFYVGSGEIKPGIRTPHILKGEIISSEKMLGTKGNKDKRK